MKKSIRKNADFSNQLIWKSVIKSSFAGIAVSVALILIFSFILSKNNLPEGAPKILAVLSLGVGSLIAGIIIAKQQKKRGALLGLICGALIYFILLAGGLIMHGLKFSNMIFIKLLVSIICASAGGMIGVNLKRKQRL